jgi:ABC-type transporter Mla maintaining outer membrane lipid asymmetry permease subunit MlaE
LIIALLIREVGPLLTAVVITLRSGSAIAMEMGYMKVLGET